MNVKTLVKSQVSTLRAPQLLLAIALFAAPAASFAIDAEPQARDTQPAATIARSPEIISVAGDYFFGDGLNHNYNLKLTTSGTFTYEMATYEGVVDKAEGRYLLQDGKVVLKATTGRPSKWPAGITTELIPVPWGERLYLIPSNDLVGFCNAVNQGAEPIHGFTDGKYLLLEGDVDKEVSGKPSLPDAYAGLILNAPVSGRVLCADQQGYWKVGAGRLEGLLPGMELGARSPDDQLSVVVRVIKVDDHTALVQITPQSLEETQAQSAHKLSLTDWTVSSRFRADAN